MIFYQFTTKLLDNIDLIVNYHLNEIEIYVKWSSTGDLGNWTISYVDDECTLPSISPLYYLCSSSSKNHSLNPTFYSYWFQLDSSFYRRLFAHLTTDEDQIFLLLSLPDGRILLLSENHPPNVWYTSPNTSPISILGLYYDLNSNLLDAILSSSTNSKFPKMIVNHFILCESFGCLVLVNSTNLRRILIDNSIKSACVYSNNLIYMTANEIRSISISNLLKPNNEDIISQTKSLRFGHFEKLIVDGQEIILYYENGTFERLKSLLPRTANLSRSSSLVNQTKKLACLATTITNLQANACLLQRLLTKAELFYQLNLSMCLKFIQNQWKLILTDQQSRTFQSNDFILILLCQFSENHVRIYQLTSANNWMFKMNESITKTYLCQPILILRSPNSFHYQLGHRRIVLSLEEQVQEEELSLEHYFPKKFRSMRRINATMQQYHLVLTLRNEAATNFKKLNIQLARRLLLGETDFVNMEIKQQDIKVDTDNGLVDSLTIQVILSSLCLRRLIITFSTLVELFYTSKTTEDKYFIKQTDMVKLTDLIQNIQAKLSDQLTDDVLLSFLQIRIYLSMFRLGSNYTVQVY
ncbi:unnamed protein product [Adineta ricciae]|uniref:Uncharacterized protein n=1 Tax=Adineta ricciae TaxID=249248 RepID=A0A815CE91_ADIRI|nr:unnamed protein product [Adineta ricciae]CAF1281659.1 unnamed protein product [Adineta ricciae]